MKAFIKNLRHEDHKKALVATLVFIMLMILFFLLVSLEYPNPPIEEKVVEVQIDFGSADSGGGQMSNSPEIVPQKQPESATEKATQDESPVTVSSAKGNSTTSKNTTTTPPTTTTSTVPEPDPKPSVDQGLGFPGGGTAGNGGGTGPGFGDGGGVGDGGEGSNPGSGNYKTSRKVVSEPKVEANSQEEGKVDVDIYVNEFGKVVRVEFNESQTTTGSDYLRKLARKSAFLIKFDKDPGAPTIKVKTKIYNFRKV